LADKEEEISSKGIVQWIRTRLARTYVAPTFFSFEAANPLSYLGMLAFICFILLGITGIMLMIYYVPESTASYNSVAKISYLIPYGFEVRQLHYWLANFMIVLSIIHLFYLYFKRKYKLYDEILWLTGIIVGLFTVFETYTGYVLIMNMRAMLALDIGTGILRNIATVLAVLFQGFSYTDTVMRMYTLHIVLLPAVIVILFILHFPRKLSVDAPVILAMIGAAFVVGGLAPAELGSKFIPGQPSMIIVPEWYLTGIYALLRTGVQVFAATVLLPFIFVFILILVPFHDKQRSLGATGRAVHATIGIAAMLHIALVTFWGYRAGDLVNVITSEKDLPIDPAAFYGLLIATVFLIFGISRLLVNLKFIPGIGLAMNSLEINQKLSRSVSMILLLIVLLLQLSLFYSPFYLQSFTPKGLPMMDAGLSILGFAVATYIYRASM
jgi:ubiquinol-cytochrome c reductase cytochrome b subunit